jgi:SAM-dependent methyltransferase
MNWSRSLVRVLAAVWVGLSPAALVCAQTTAEQYKPQVGQAGKDAVWVPTSPEMVEHMLNLAHVTPDDFVVDLGSGDGRTVIAAAKRGARALGVEYNADLVELSKRTAEKEGVAERATFVQGDMFEADFSQATVLPLFLLPDNLRRLAPKLLDLKPGARIVVNTFGPPGWQPDMTEKIEAGCMSFCEAMLYIVPAKVQGAWQLPQGRLTLDQEFQKISGSVSSTGRVIPIENGKLRGDQITFVLDGSEYSGRVNGNTIEGMVTAGSSQQAFTAKRVGR